MVVAVAVVERLARRLLDADLGDGARDDERADAERAQARVEVGAVERAVAVLVDDELAGRGRELVDHVAQSSGPSASS